VGAISALESSSLHLQDIRGGPKTDKEWCTG